MDCVFLGYAHCSTTYRFLIVKSEVSDLHVDTIMESRDATFFENIFPMKDMHNSTSQANDLTPESIIPIEHSEHTREQILEKDGSIVLRRSKRQRIEKSL